MLAEVGVEAQELGVSTWLQSEPRQVVHGHDRCLGRVGAAQREDSSLEVRRLNKLSHASDEERAELDIGISHREHRAGAASRTVGADVGQVTAQLLEVSVASVNSALQRARTQLRDRLPSVTQAAELAALGDANVRDLATRYARAIEEADVNAVLSLLTEDASWSMPPLRSWYRGRTDVIRFLSDFVFPERWRHQMTWANGQVAVAGYLFETAEDHYVPAALDVLDLRDHKIAAVTGFLTDTALSPDERIAVGAPAAIFPRFGLPLRLPA